MSTGMWVTAALVVYLSSAVFCGGVFFATAQGKFPTIAEESFREDSGYGVIVGALYGLLGPLGVFMCLCLTGFMEFGWRLPFRRARDKAVSA